MPTTREMQSPNRRNNVLPCKHRRGHILVFNQEQIPLRIIIRDWAKDLKSADCVLEASNIQYVDNNYYNANNTIVAMQFQGWWTEVRDARRTDNPKTKRTKEQQGEWLMMDGWTEEGTVDSFERARAYHIRDGYNRNALVLLHVEIAVQ